MRGLSQISGGWGVIEAIAFVAIGSFIWPRRRDRDSQMNNFRPSINSFEFYKYWINSTQTQKIENTKPHLEVWAVAVHSTSAGNSYTTILESRPGRKFTTPSWGKNINRRKIFLRIHKIFRRFKIIKFEFIPAYCNRILTKTISHLNLVLLLMGHPEIRQLESSCVASINRQTQAKRILKAFACPSWKLTEIIIYRGTSSPVLIFFTSFSNTTQHSSSLPFRRSVTKKGQFVRSNSWLCIKCM